MGARFQSEYAIAVALLVQAAQAAETIKIGFNAPLTGFAAADGKSALTGAELAMAQVNTAGGVNGKQLELIVYDDQASPKESYIGLTAADQAFLY